MSVTKFCADHLRAFSANHGVKLKSGHAHELVAAFFGYKSKAAMLVDALNPETNLAQVNILVLIPSSFVAERLACLEGLPADLPDIYALGEEMFVKLISQENLSFRVFASLAHLAEILTTEYLHKHGDLILPPKFKMSQTSNDIFFKPQYEFNPEIITSDSDLELIVTNTYSTENTVRFQGSIDIKVAIRLHRIAGRVGYSRADISFVGGSSQALSQSGVIR
jgi:hypothetical protein